MKKSKEKEIEDKIKQCLKLQKEQNNPTPEFEKLCEEILDTINKYYGKPEEVIIGITNENKYIKPSLHDILKEQKMDKYDELLHSWNFFWIELPSLVEYYHSCLALHYYEEHMMKKRP